MFMKLSFTAFTRPLCESDITILSPDRSLNFKYSKILDHEYFILLRSLLGHCLTSSSNCFVSNDTNDFA